MQRVSLAGTRSGFPKSTLSASECFDDGLIVSAGFPCQDLSIAGRQAGLNGSRSFLGLLLIGLLSRTSFTPGEDGCPSCGAGCTPEGMPVCRLDCEPLTLGLSISAPAGGWLPTPTASSYGSCRGGGAGRVGKWRYSLHSRGILHPEDWERMMGFPIGWTDSRDLEMLPCRSPLNSSSAASGR